MAKSKTPAKEPRTEQEPLLASEAPKKSGDWVGKLWEFFSSMKLGLILLLVLALASIAGTILPQNSPPEMYNPKYYPIYDFLGLTDLYHTWWFTLLLFMLSMNLLVCSLNRVKPIIKMTRTPQIKVSDNYLKQLKDRYTLSQAGEANPLVERVTEAMKKEKYRVLTEKDGEKVHIYGDKGRLGLWGSFITHLSFLIIVIGAIIGGYFGYEGEMSAPVNSTFTMKDVFWTRSAKMGELLGGSWAQKANFSVKVNNFQTVYRKDGSVQDWISDLSIIDGGKEVLRKSIRVNDPIEYKGIKMYQSYFGNTVNMTVSNGKNTSEEEVAEGGYIQVPNTNYYVGRITPSQGRIYYEVYKGNQKVTAQVAALNQPVFIGNNEATVTFTKLGSFTGLSLRKDPGVWVVWVGCGLLVLGMLFAFYLPHRRVWAVVTDNAGVSSLEMGGFAQKNKLGFQSEFARLAEKLK